MNVQLIAGVIAAAIAAGTVIVFASLGELLAERSGVMNLGLEGIMALGAVSGIIAESWVPNPYFAFLFAVGVGFLAGIIFAVATVSVRANQVVCGLATTFFGTGLAGRLGASHSGQPAPAPFTPIRIPVLGDLPLIGDAFFNHNILVYIAYIVLPPLFTWLLYKTRHGMNVRSIGEDPATSDACGIQVTGMRFLYTAIGGAMAAAGGAYLTLAFTPTWTEGVTGGRGWIAIALVIFGAWRPWPVVFGALLFGGVTSLGYVAQAQGWGIPSAFLSMSPYLGTLILMIVPVLFKPKTERRFGASPTALGLPYYRESG